MTFNISVGNLNVELKLDVTMSKVGYDGKHLAGLWDVNRVCSWEIECMSNRAEVLMTTMKLIVQKPKLVRLGLSAWEQGLVKGNVPILKHYHPISKQTPDVPAESLRSSSPMPICSMESTPSTFDRVFTLEEQKRQWPSIFGDQAVAESRSFPPVSSKSPK